MYCTDQLGNPQLVEPARTELTVELIRTLATHAVNSPAAEREAIFAAARRVSQDAQRTMPPSPRLVLIRLQDALTLLAQGELGRQELEAGALPADRHEATRQALREATELLETLDKELTREIPLRRRTAPRPGELSAEQIFSLQQHVQHQLARAYRNRALLFDPASSDRLSLLIQATETLQRPLTQLPPDDPLVQAIQLDLAECQRLLGRLDEAAQLVAGLDIEGIDASVRLRARAELIRLAIAKNNLPAMQRFIDLGRTAAGQSAAELDFAWFEAFLLQARRASEGKDLDAARRFQDQAAETARFLDETYGPYWGRRADQLLVAAIPRGAGVVNVPLLSRTADSLFLKGDFDRAIAAYDDASAQARAAGDLNASFDLAYKAALVEQKRERHAESARRFRNLGKAFAAHPQAAQAHLLAAWHLAQVVKTDAGATSDYEAILREHLALWPTAESAAQARIWMGRLEENRQQWAAAIEAYGGVPRGSPHFAAAIAGLATCWPQRLAQQAAAGVLKTDEVTQALRQFQQAMVGPENQLPERFSAAEQTAALAAAELVLNYQPTAAAEAEGMLRAALARSPDAPSAWKSAAQAQLVVALAGQPSRQDEALALVREVGSSSTEQMLALLAGLSQVARQSRAETRGPIARVQLAAVDLLWPSRAQLPVAARHSLDRVRAEALAAAGRRDEALAAYAQLVKEQPDNGTIQEDYADLLLAGTDKTSLTAALSQWRIIASRTKPRTPRWFKAKYSVALAQLQLGDPAGAATLLRFLLETPPGLKGTGWEEPFGKLLARCAN
ncbi:MAG: hypothetical protein SFU86_20440 [Pirellulaceae bacterium]|nr:hypothetical protein [Pirellulaceae bacterium]